MRAKEVIEKLKRNEEVSMQNLFGLINQYPLTTLMVRFHFICNFRCVSKRNRRYSGKNRCLRRC